MRGERGWSGSSGSAPQGVVAFHALLKRRPGDMDFQALETTRKKFQGILGSVPPAGTLEIIEADPDLLPRLVIEASEITKKEGKLPRRICQMADSHGHTSSPAPQADYLSALEGRGMEKPFRPFDHAALFSSRPPSSPGFWEKKRPRITWLF